MGPRLSFQAPDMNSTQDSAEQPTPMGYPDEQSLAEYNDEVIALRTKQLVGKTVQGTLMLRGGRFWVRWNRRKCDTIYIRKTVLHKALGPEPKEGTQVRCMITSLGPDISKLICQTAWFMHPQCRELEVVPRSPPRARFQPKPVGTRMCSFDRSNFRSTNNTPSPRANADIVVGACQFGSSQLRRSTRFGSGPSL